MSDADTILNQLTAIVKQRATVSPDESYTANLLQAGTDRILRKVGEEAGEFIIAGKNNDKAEICAEGADLLFHMMVFLQSKGLTLDDIATVLKQRFP